MVFGSRKHFSSLGDKFSVELLSNQLIPSDIVKDLGLGYMLRYIQTASSCCINTYLNFAFHEHVLNVTCQWVV